MKVELEERDKISAGMKKLKQEKIELSEKLELLSTELAQKDKKTTALDIAMKKVLLSEDKHKERLAQLEEQLATLTEAANETHVEGMLALSLSNCWALRVQD